MRLSPKQAKSLIAAFIAIIAAVGTFTDLPEGLVQLLSSGAALLSP